MTSKATSKLAKSITTIGYAPTEALEAERRNQLGKGRNQSLRLLEAIESELKSRKACGGRRASITDMLGY